MRLDSVRRVKRKTVVVQSLQRKRAVVYVSSVRLRTKTSYNLFLRIVIVGDVMPSFLGGTKRASSSDVAAAISPSGSGSTIAGDIAGPSTHTQPPKSALKQYTFFKSSNLSNLTF